MADFNKATLSKSRNTEQLFCFAAYLRLYWDFEVNTFKTLNDDPFYPTSIDCKYCAILLNVISE